MHCAFSRTKLPVSENPNPLGVLPPFLGSVLREREKEGESGQDEEREGATSLQIDFSTPILQRQEEFPDSAIVCAPDRPGLSGQ